MHQIVPKELLEKSGKILFIGGVAIGDFAYLHNYFKALSEQYPNLKIDLWNDEYRGKSCLLRWKSQKHNIVYEWLESCAFLNKIYKNVGAWWNMPKFFKQLRHENYPIVVCLYNLRGIRVAKFAKLISPYGIVVRGIDISDFDSIVDATDYTFNKNFGISLTEEQRKLAFQISEKMMDDVKLMLTQFGITSNQKVVLLNYSARDIKRCWEINKIVELIKALKKDNYFLNTSFIINSWPDKKACIELIVRNNFLQNVYVFSAQKSFFELPAVISLCDLIISVDTSVIHLAYALDKPLVALMRQKNAWIFPKTKKTFAIFTNNRSDWARQIKVDYVFEKVKEFSRTI